MPYPHTLTGLTTREAITNALYRAVLAFDRNDISLIDSAFAGEDSMFEMHPGPQKTVIPPLSAVRDTIFAKAGPMVWVIFLLLGALSSEPSSRGISSEWRMARQPSALTIFMENVC